MFLSLFVPFCPLLSLFVLIYWRSCIIVENYQYYCLHTPTSFHGMYDIIIQMQVLDV